MMHNRFLIRSSGRLVLLLSMALILPNSRPAQAQQGLVALYTFKEGSGTTVTDVSGVAPALNLTIPNPGAVEWLPDGGILIKQNVLIASPGPATKIIEACMASNQLTVEAYVKPANLTQDGPARMISVSVDTSNRNFTLGQHFDTWQMRTRTPDTGNNGATGSGSFSTAAKTVEVRLMHVVFTRDDWGHETIYVDGQVLAERDVWGDFTNWNAAYRMVVGGELNNQRYWHGEVHKVAIYSRALTPQEVTQNYQNLLPQLEIVDLSPFRGQHFHSAQAGITFRAIGHFGNTIAQSGVKLILDGQDRSNQLQFTGSSSAWQVTWPGLEANRTYQGEITIQDQLGRASTAVLQFDTYSLRQDGLIALYEFDEGGGSVVHDRSGAGLPLDLDIADPATVRWIQGGGLSLESYGRIASTRPASKITQPIQQSQALTVEAWVRAQPDQVGPARIVTVSQFRGNYPGTELTNSLRNFTLGQEENRFTFHLRSTETDLAGVPFLETPDREQQFPSHVVYTRAANGEARLFVDGAEVASGTVTGDFSTWMEGYFLGLGTELNVVTQSTGDSFRRWLGDFYRVAIYHRALSPAEVLESFNALGGDDTTPPTVPQNLQVNAGAIFTHLTWNPSTDDSGRIVYEVERNGAVIGTFVTEASYLDLSVSPSTSYTYRVRAMDFARNTSAFSSQLQATTTGMVQVNGVVKAEFYTGLTGAGTLNLLLESPKFPNNPDVTRFLPSLETPSNWADNYGVRVTGWFVPPQTGDYVFFIASDDEGEFRLSTDATPANLKLIAHEPMWNPSRDWTSATRRQFGENRSDVFWGSEWPWDPVTFEVRTRLTSGQAYYFEALMKEGTGGDHLSVTYKLANEADPANGTPTRMTGNVIRASADPAFIAPMIKTPPQSQAVLAGQPATLEVELAEVSSQPLAYQWQFNGVNIPGATSRTYTLSSFQLANAGSYRVLISNLAGSVTSEPAVLSRVATSKGFTLVDDFELSEPGNLNGQLGWSANGGTVVADPANPDNQVAGFIGGSGERGTHLPALIPAGNTGTLFFRLRVDTDNSDLSTPVLNWSVGMSHVAISGNGAFGDYQSQLNQNRDGGNTLPEEMRVRDAGAFVSLTPLQAGAWYKIWMIIDNNADNTRIYMQGGQFTQPTLLQAADGRSTFVFRNSAAGPLNQDLIRFFVRLAGAHTGNLYLDDIWLDPSKMNLEEPVMDTPAPLALSVSRAAGAVVISWPAAGSDSFILETSPTLSAPNWTTVSIVPVVNGGQKSVSVTPSAQSGFYRLR
jgi:hypothetical protein